MGGSSRWDCKGGSEGVLVKSLDQVGSWPSDHDLVRGHEELGDEDVVPKVS